MGGASWEKEWRVGSSWGGTMIVYEGEGGGALLIGETLTSASISAASCASNKRDSFPRMFLAVVPRATCSCWSCWARDVMRGFGREEEDRKRSKLGSMRAIGA